MQIDLVRTLIELINSVKNTKYEEILTKDLVKELITHNNNEIKDILQEQDLDTKIYKLYMSINKNKLNPDLVAVLETSNNFSDKIYALLVINSTAIADINDRKKIVRLILNSENNQGKEISELASNKDFMSQKYAIEIIEEIATAKSLANSYYAAQLAGQPYMKNRKDALEIIKIVANAKDAKQSYYARIAVKDYRLREHEDFLDVLKIIANADSEEQAEYAYKTATNSVVLAERNIKEIIREVARVKGTTNLKYAKRIATDKNTIASPKLLKLLEIVSYAKEEYQALGLYDVATSPQFLMSPYTIDLAKIIVSFENEDKLAHILDAAQDPDLLESPHALELVNLICNAKEEFQTAFACRVVYCRENVTRKTYAPALVKIVIDADTEEKAEYASEVAQNSNILSLDNENIHSKKAPYIKKMFGSSKEAKEAKVIPALEITKIVASAKENFQSEIAKDFALDKRVIKRKDAIELVRLASTIKTKERAEMILFDIYNDEANILARPDALEIIKILATAEEDYQAHYASIVATNPEVLKRGDAKDLIRLVATAKEEYQAEFASYAAQDKDVLSLASAKDIVKKVANYTRVNQAALSEDYQDSDDAVLQIINLVRPKKTVSIEELIEKESYDEINEALDKMAKINANQDIVLDTKIFVKSRREEK